ncbi:MAG: dimethylarginine dimethylaminohydrolase family protein, partial [Chloroflexota bacterium]
MIGQRTYGAQSMSAPLRDVLVKRPGPAFGAAFDDPAYGFLHPVDLDVARREHDDFVELLASLGPRVHVLETELESPDLVYTFDPLLVTDRGAIPLRPGKPNRADEPAAIEAWTIAAGIPTVGRIEAPGTVEGGDTLWLQPVLFCIGRTLRTNSGGVAQLAGLVGGDVRVFDVPYWRGRAELIHLMSVISPVADDLAVVYMPLLPVGLWELLVDLDVRIVEVPDAEFPTLGCNVLAVRPGVVILAEGNPRTAAALASAGCEVHTYPATEIGINGSGG